jgi:hypothetical protein
MGLDLSLDGQTVGTNAELLQAHELLLRRMDELKVLADRLEAEGKRVEGRLRPVEVAHRQQSESQERLLREGFARLEKQWSDTTARYRALADDLSRRPGVGTRSPSRFDLPTVALVAALLGATAGMGATYLLDAWPRDAQVVEQPPKSPAAAKPRPAAPSSKPAHPRTH